MTKWYFCMQTVTCWCMLMTVHSFSCWAKRPVKVHVWAGISLKGATGICTFEGSMDADQYVEVLRQTLLPFLREVMPVHHFMQDNEPQHTSKKAVAFLATESINWWKTPAESPDCNPLHTVPESSRFEILNHDADDDRRSSWNRCRWKKTHWEPLARAEGVHSFSHVNMLAWYCPSISSISLQIHVDISNTVGTVTG